MARACREAPGSGTCTTLAGVAIKMEIYPVKANDVFDHTDPINKIKNPAGIVMYADDAVTENTAAVLEITNHVPSSLNLSDDDETIQWSITSLGGNAKFFRSKSVGKTVRIYGTSAGEILVEADYGWINKAKFRASVVPLKQLYFRANRITNSGTAPSFDVDDIKKHIRVANIYLRQIGVKLVPDASAQVATASGNPAVGDPGVPAAPPVAAIPGTDAKVVRVTQRETGYFDVEVNDPLMTQTAGSRPDMERAIMVNARNEIINLAYCASINGGGGGGTILGIALLRAANHGGPATNPPSAAVMAGTQTITETATPSTSWIAPNGLPAGSIPSPPPPRDGPGGVPTGAAAAVTMQLMGPQGPGGATVYQPASPPTRDRNLLWGLAMHGAASPEQDVGNTMAHEIGHVLGLRHRKAPGSDTLPWPPQENLMSWAPSPTAEDLDVLQCKAVRFSELLSRANSSSAAAEYEPSDHRGLGAVGGALAGALVGAVAGAIIGAAIGHAVSHSAAGALIGAAIGAGVGALAGAIIGGILGGSDPVSP